MNITTNHVALLMKARRGITYRQALHIDQRTLGSACTRTNSRPATVDYDWDTKSFVLTEFGHFVLEMDIARKAETQKEFSTRVSRFVSPRKLKLMRRSA